MAEGVLEPTACCLELRERKQQLECGQHFSTKRYTQFLFLAQISTE